MPKVTRIFEVEFYRTEVFNGKKEGGPIKETRKVVAKNASSAAGLVGLMLAKENLSWKDEETGKMIKATSADYDPINVTLEAEAER